MHKKRIMSNLQLIYPVPFANYHFLHFLPTFLNILMAFNMIFIGIMSANRADGKWYGLNKILDFIIMTKMGPSVIFL